MPLAESNDIGRLKTRIAELELELDELRKNMRSVCGPLPQAEFHQKCLAKVADEAVRNVRTDIEASRRDAIHDLLLYGKHDFKIVNYSTDNAAHEHDQSACGLCRCIAKWQSR